MSKKDIFVIFQPPLSVLLIFGLAYIMKLPIPNITTPLMVGFAFSLFLFLRFYPYAK